MKNGYRWIPQGATPITVDGIDAVVYAYSTPSGPAAIAYGGKRSKPDWHYIYQTEERREKGIAAFFDGQRQHAEFVAQRKAERNVYQHDLKVGDILETSWGYDQTNVDFYEVVEVPSGKTVIIREIARRTTETGFMCGKTVPVRGKYIGDPITKRVAPGGYVAMDHHHAWKWDGKPSYCSWYA